MHFMSFGCLSAEIVLCALTFKANVGYKAFKLHDGFLRLGTMITWCSERSYWQIVSRKAFKLLEA